MVNPGAQQRSRAQYFEDLWIWQEARALVNDVFTDFGEGTVAARHFAFRDQIERAAISVMNNIAEGFERGTDADFARFLDIARGSVGEVRSMLYVAEDRRYVIGQVADERRTRCRRIAAGIASLSPYISDAATAHSKALPDPSSPDSATFRPFDSSTLRPFISPHPPRTPSPPESRRTKRFRRP
ncbi:MAG: four helix bundle protein [Planctomycetaceae bacterium]